MITACVALGSNLQSPAQQLHRAVLAIGALEQCRLGACSRVYRNPALGPGDQPDYLNAALLLHTRLEPLALLDALQEIEQRQGRQRGVRWGPRTLDLDLLLYGDRVVDLPRLQVPHPRLAERPFVLSPLADLLPLETPIPGLGSLGALLANCPTTGLQLQDQRLPAPLSEELPE